MSQKTKEIVQKSSLVNLFDRTLERHLLTKSDLNLKPLPYNTQITSVIESASKSIEQIQRRLFVADLDRSKDKSLYWIKRGTGRMVHNYNENGYAAIIFRFEATPEMTSKLDKEYGVNHTI